MTAIRVSERGGEIPPGAGVTDADGFPLTEGDYLASNAWTLWRAALTRAIREGAPPQGQLGALGVTLFCRMGEIEQLIWPAMTADETDPLYGYACLVREALRRFLQETGNMFELDGTGRGRAGSTWWVRSVYDGKVKNIMPILAEVESAPEPPPLRLDGVSLPSDVMACLNGRDRMHIAELLRLLAIGNASRYARMQARELQDLLQQAGIATDTVSIGSSTKLGVRADAVMRGVELEQDAEAARIVTEAHVLAVTSPAIIGASAAFRAAAEAILEENAALIEERDRLLAENRELRLQPVTDEMISKALKGKQAEIDELTLQLRAARRVRGG